MSKRKLRSKKIPGKKPERKLSRIDFGLVAKLLIAFGLACFIFSIYLIWERSNPKRLSFKNYSGNYKNYSLNNLPVRIIINNVDIDLPVFPAKLQKGHWDTTTEGASYLTTSPLPGEQGNSIIYAHDWASLFGPLENIQPDAQIEIEYKDKKRKKFTVIKTLIVPYDNSDILDQTQDKRITLYTCTGFLDSQRFVVVAIYTPLKSNP